MRAAPWIVLGWAATVAGAWFLGGAAGKPSATGATDAAEVARLRDRVAELERSVAAPGLATSDRPAGTTPPAEAVPAPRPGGAKAVAPAARATSVPAGPLSLAGVGDTEEASRRLLAYVEAKLAEGASGHLEILRALDEHVFDPKTRSPLFQGPEEEMAPHIYSWVRMAVTHEAEVVALTETVLRTMAESPSTYADLDDDTIESFTEGLGPVLPGVVDAATLDRLRGYARKVLDTPEATQPSAVRGNRNDLKRLLEGAWAPRLTAEEAKVRLREAGLTPEDAIAILRRLPAGAWAEVDAASLLGPAFDRGDWNVLRVLPRASLDTKTVAALDARAFATVSGGKNSNWFHRYLDATGRASWDRARPAIELGLARGGAVADESAKVLLQLNPRPFKEDVRGLLDRYTVSEPVRTQLGKAFRLDE